MLVLDTEGQRRKASDWVWAAKNGSRVEFKGPKRTLDQNSLMWALLTDIAVHMRKTRGLDYSTEDWKHIFLHGWGREVKFLPALDGKGVVPIPQSSSDLDKEEMTDFIEYILKEGTEREVVFHNKNEEPSSPAVPPATDGGSGDSSPPVPAAEESSSQAADPAGGTSGDEPEQPSADLRLSDEDRAWLKVTTRMLWAATAVGEQELLAATFKGARENHTPDSISKAARDRGTSIYQKCKLVCFGEKDAGETLEAIALVACVEPREIVS